MNSTVCVNGIISLPNCFLVIRTLKCSQQHKVMLMLRHQDVNTPLLLGKVSTVPIPPPNLIISSNTELLFPF